MWIVTTLCALFSITSAAKLELPKWAQRCVFDDPNLNICLEKAMQAAYIKFAPGYPELGIPQYDPLIIPELDIKQGGDKTNVNLNLNFKNMTIFGVGDLKFRNTKVLLDELTLQSEAFSDKLTIEADYETKGKILLLNLSGKGRCNVTMHNMVTHFKLKFKPTMKRKETYWPIEEYKINFVPEKVSYYFSNLISTKDKALNDGLNDFMNQNWQLIFEETGPAFEEAFNRIYQSAANRVFARIPINKILVWPNS